MLGWKLTHVGNRDPSMYWLHCGAVLCYDLNLCREVFCSLSFFKGICVWSLSLCLSRPLSRSSLFLFLLSSIFSLLSLLSRSPVPLSSFLSSLLSFIYLLSLLSLLSLFCFHSLSSFFSPLSFFSCILYNIGKCTSAISIHGLRILFKSNWTEFLQKLREVHKMMEGLN